MDTSVLIAGLRSTNGAAAEILRLILLGQAQILLALPLALEYKMVALRPDHLQAFSLSREEVEFFVSQLEALAEPVYLSRSLRPISTDPNDDMVLELAIYGRADCLVTNNLRDLKKFARQFGIKVLKPNEFLVEMQRRESI